MKATVGLIRLLEKNSTPELVVKYIYINVFELMKETQSKLFSNQTEIIQDLSKYYFFYYEKVIKQSEEEWIKTILPPYIHGHKNFYMGVAGRLAFFSINLENEVNNYNDREKRYDLLIKLSCSSSLFEYAARKKEAAEYLNCNADDLFEKVDLYPWSEDTDTMLARIPDTYYWYGNPKNWSDCYEINLDKNNEIEIRKSQILILESKGKEEDMTDDEDDRSYKRKCEVDSIYEGMLDNVCESSIDSDEDLLSDTAGEQLNFGEILLIYKGNFPYNYIDNFEKFPLYITLSVSDNHTVDQERIDIMMNNYKVNVNLKNGYSKEIQELWTEYNKINDLYQNELVRNQKKSFLNYKVLEPNFFDELKLKFTAEYKKKLVKIKKNIRIKNENIEESQKYFTLELERISNLINKLLKK